MSRIWRLTKKLGLSVLSLSVAATVAEIYLRSQEPGPFSFIDRSPYEESVADLHVRHVPGFVGRWDGTWYEIDGRGFRGPERTPTFEPQELRIACVGDSCTFGKGVLEEETWPRLLEGRLRGEGHDATVFNLGINGAHPRVYRQLLEEHAGELKADLVLVGFNINDFPNVVKAIDEEVFEGRTLRTMIPQGLRDSLGRLALYRKVRAVYYDTRREEDWDASESLASGSAMGATTASGDAGRTALDAEWKLHGEYLEAIRDLSREAGGRAAVFLFPYESQVYLPEYDQTPIRTLEALCEGLGIPFVDLTRGLREAARGDSAPPSLFLPGDRYHPNGAGYGVIAREVDKQLRGQGLLPTAQDAK